MVHQPEVFSVVKNLQAAEVGDLVLTASQIDSKVIVEKKSVRPVDTDRMQKSMASTVTQLQESGFFKVLSMSQRAPNSQSLLTK
jgi:hypothetical protein